MIESTTTGFADAGDESYGFKGFPSKRPYMAGMSRQYGAQLKAHDSDFRGIFKEGYDANVKALNTETGGAGTAGFALIPVFVDPRIVDISRKYTPLVELVPRVSNMGITADYNRITAKGAATTALEDGAQTDQDNTLERVSKTIKYLYSVGRVTGPAQAAIPFYEIQQFTPTGAGNTATNPFSSVGAPNAMQQEMLIAARALKELEENLIINGNSTTSVGSGPDGSEFDGFIQLISTNNQTDLSGANLEWSNVEDAVGAAYVDSGRPNLCVGSANAVIALRAVFIDTFRISPTDNAVELVFGISAAFKINTIVGDIPVIPSQFLDNTAASRSLWFLDMDWIEMRVLLDMSFEQLAQTNDSRRFMLKIYECLVVKAPEFNASIINIA